MTVIQWQHRHKDPSVPESEIKIWNQIFYFEQEKMFQNVSKKASTSKTKKKGKPR